MVTLIGLFLPLIFLPLLLWARMQEWPRFELLFKALASSGFVIVGLSAPGVPGRDLIIVGLLFGWLGDVCLAVKGERAFLVGLGAFLLGHIAYAAVGYQLPSNRGAILGGSIVALGLSLFALRWLWRRLSPTFQIPVILYIAVVVAMVGAAAGQVGQPHAGYFIGGAILFALSDLAVARQRFVASGFANALIGLPMYYTGQLMIAVWVVLRGLGASVS